MANEGFKYKRTAEELSDTKKEKMLRIIKELKERMREIDELARELEPGKTRFSVSPKKARSMLEEIKVPALELLKEGSDKKK